MQRGKHVEWMGQTLHWIVQAFRDTWNARWTCRFVRLTEHLDEQWEFVSSRPCCMPLLHPRSDTRFHVGAIHAFWSTTMTQTSSRVGKLRFDGSFGILFFGWIDGLCHATFFFLHIFRPFERILHLLTVPLWTDSTVLITMHVSHVDPINQHADGNVLRCP